MRDPGSKTADAEEGKTRERVASPKHRVLPKIGTGHKNRLSPYRPLPCRQTSSSDCSGTLPRDSHSVGKGSSGKCVTEGTYAEAEEALWKLIGLLFKHCVSREI